jgi:hypothetical protein
MLVLCCALNISLKGQAGCVCPDAVKSYWNGRVRNWEGGLVGLGMGMGMGMGRMWKLNVRIGI